MISNQFHCRKRALWKFKKIIQNHKIPKIYITSSPSLVLQDSDSDSDIKKFNSSTNYNRCKMILYLYKIVPKCSLDSVYSFRCIHWPHRTSRTLGKHSQIKFRLASKWEGKYEIFGGLVILDNFLNFQSALFL